MRFANKGAERVNIFKKMHFNLILVFRRFCCIYVQEVHRLGPTHMHEADDRKKLFFLSQKKTQIDIFKLSCNVLLIFRFDLQSVQLKSKCSVAYHSAQNK